MFFLNASWISKETQNHICTLWIHMGTKNKHWILRDQKLKTNLKKKTHTHLHPRDFSRGILHLQNVGNNNNNTTQLYL